jgi:hypothetical protein
MFFNLIMSILLIVYIHNFQFIVHYLSMIILRNPLFSIIKYFYRSFVNIYQKIIIHV